MNAIGKYFKVYPIKTLRSFQHWNELDQIADDTNVYLQDNYVVTKSVFKDQQIIFENVTTDWVDFCHNQLGFKSPTFAPDSLVFEKGIVGERLPPFIKSNFDTDKPQYWWRLFEAVYEVPLQLDALKLKQVVRQLLAQYDGLRLRIVNNETEYRKFIALVDPNVFVQQDISSLSDDELQPALREILEAQWASLNFIEGPLLRFVYLDRGRTCPAILLVIIHHALMDGYSLDLLINDFEDACRQLAEGRPLNILPPTATFKDWAEHMYAYCRSDSSQQDFNWWLSLPWERFRISPVDYPENQVITKVTPSGAIQGYYRYPKEIAAPGKLTVEETQALLKVPQIYQVGMMDVLYTALAITFYRWKKLSPIFVFISDNNRYFFDDLNLTRMIGFITSSCPVLLELPDGDTTDYRSALNSIKAQLDRIPHHGNPWNWFEMYYADAIDAHIPNLAHMFFLYNGQTLDTRSSRPLGGLRRMMLPARTRQIEPIQTELQQQSLAFGSFSEIINGEFHIRWMYKDGLHTQSTAETLVNTYLDVLRSFSQGNIL